jgi:predicted lipoprotein with Yx(FWY)xxD motif
MHRARLAAFAPIVLVVLIAACGGSGKSSTKSASTSGTSTGRAASGYGSGPSSGSNSTSVALVTTKQHGKLGTILAYGQKKMTVYLFEGDKGKRSACTGACAAVWPPVTGKPKAAGGAMSAHLGTITRSNGVKQVTYNGHPLYRYAKDGDAGDAYGEGIKSFGAEWYALAPSGKKVDLS